MVFIAFYCSGITSIGFGAGVVAIVQPIQAPIARTATNAISKGAAMSQILIDSRSGIKRAII